MPGRNDGPRKERLAQSGLGSDVPQQREVARLLSEIRNGNEQAAGQLIPIVYQELRRMAASMMKNERPGHTLQPTAVVHEAYLKMMDGARLTVENRAHFFAIAGRSMRQVLVDHARRRLANKRGGDIHRQLEFEDEIALTEQQ